jgi:monomeric isocitrate dehydrogenase
LFINQALASANENGELYLKGRALTWEGRIIAKLGNDTPLEAIQRVEPGLETLTELETSPDIAIGRLFLGNCIFKKIKRKLRLSI